MLSSGSIPRDQKTSNARPSAEARDLYAARRRSYRTGGGCATPRCVCFSAESRAHSRRPTGTGFTKSAARHSRQASAKSELGMLAEMGGDPDSLPRPFRSTSGAISNVENRFPYWGKPKIAARSDGAEDLFWGSLRIAGLMARKASFFARTPGLNRR